MGSEPATSARRAGAIGARLTLISLIVAATGILLGALFLPAGLVLSDLLTAVRSDVLDIPPLGEADTPPQNSYVYATDGQLLAELTFEENRVPVALADIPQVTIDAVLATEDATFYEHEGVNHLAIVRAALANLRAGGIESGASTITQQYVKLAFLSPEQTLQRKIQEAIYAIQLEERLTKDEILERYLNRSYFGRGVYGIGTAAERYFSKEVGELDLGESAMLAGLLRAPEANNPINSLENATARRDIVLRQMATHGFITADQAEAARTVPLEVDVSEPPPPANPFWVDWVSSLLVNEDTAQALGTQLGALEAMGPTFEERRQVVFQSGLRIHTTLDPELQAEAEARCASTSPRRTRPPNSSHANRWGRSSRSTPRTARSSRWRSARSPTARARRTTATSAPTTRAGCCATARRSTPPSPGWAPAPVARRGRPSSRWSRRRRSRRASRPG
jgi:penicillin-binding protein 1A